ncbi:MAG: TonB-dependent receptor [Bacteroidota bacterium]
MKISKITAVYILSLFSALATTAQTQTVKGVIMDSQSEYPLIGATVQLIGSDPIIGSVTDLDGRFVLSNVPIGRQNFVVSYIGYKTIKLPNTLVTSGKEVVLRILLEESVESLQEVVITADTNKDLPINDLAKVSARTFNLEEVTRFSGGRNDIARLASSFAGVSGADDARNDIVVRGNSPTGLLWRVEGIPIATTNHFATQGTTGGPVNALNPNLLRTSDFLTGAFPAEYGNANAAVFDVLFRNGNSDTYEFTGQVSAFSGAEFMAEGPISRKNNSSFVASYRYGIASLAATGTSSIPVYQDFSFKVNLGETKLGRFELFGLGGLSNIEFLGDDVDQDDLFADPAEDEFIENQLALVGISNTLRLSKNTFLKTSLGASTNYFMLEQDNRVLDADDNLLFTYRGENIENRENRFTLTSTLNTKFNARWSLRAGFLNETYDVSFFEEDRNDRIEIPDTNPEDGIPDFFITTIDINNTFNLLQTYAQAEYKLSDDLSTTFGFHSQYLEFTDDFIIEPRAAISWQSSDRQRWSAAYGLHAQTVPFPVLFFEEQISPGISERTNENLDFFKSHHFVLGMDRNLAPDWRLKTEVYYQSLFDVPVEKTPSGYSILNQGADFGFEEKGSLVNEGSGYNVGIEATLEKFFSKNYYGLLTASLFDSRYEGSDGIERNTAFNNNLVANLLMGREWAFGAKKQNAWTIDTRITYAGGRPFTPIDLMATRANLGREILVDNNAFSQTYNDYFRLDIKFGVRVNRPKVSHQFFIDLQNITDRENEFERRFNTVTNQINTVDQIGFFPDVLYRIQF